MTARIEGLDPIEQTVSGSNAGKRTIRAVRDLQGGPDKVLHDLLDVVEADGRHVAPSPRLRAWCNEIRKAIEASRS